MPGFEKIQQDMVLALGSSQSIWESRVTHYKHTEKAYNSGVSNNC